MEAAKLVNDVYVPEGYEAEVAEGEEQTAATRVPTPPPVPAAQSAAASSPPKKALAAEPPPPPPAPTAPPTVGNGVAMRFLVPSQAKAPPKLPPS